MFRQWTRREYEAMVQQLDGRALGEWPAHLGPVQTCFVRQEPGPIGGLARQIAWRVLEFGPVVFVVTETQAFPTGSFPCILQAFERMADLGDGTEPHGLQFSQGDDEWLAALLATTMYGLWDAHLMPLDGAWLLRFSNDEYIDICVRHGFDAGDLVDAITSFARPKGNGDPGTESNG